MIDPHVPQAAGCILLHHGRVTGERPVAATSHEEVISLITGELSDESRALQTTNGGWA